MVYEMWRKKKKHFKKVKKMPHTANCHVLEAGSRKCLVFFLKNYKKALQINILLIINESSYYWSSSPNYTEKRDAKEKSLDLWIETIADSLKSRMTLSFPPYTNLALWIKKLSKPFSLSLIWLPQRETANHRLKS